MNLGAGFQLTEGDIIINSMYDMMKYSMSGYQRCPQELWESVMAAENSMITLVESILNQQFENILKNNALGNLRAFFQLGGVQVSGSGMTGEWILTMIENISNFLREENTTEIPSASEIYSIFTSGIETQYFNVFDKANSMQVGLVSGMVLSSTIDQITTIDYRGNILPHVLTLGDTGDIQLAPAVSHGLIYETSLLSPTLSKTVTSTRTGHVSFTGPGFENKGKDKNFHLFSIQLSINFCDTFICHTFI